MTGHLMTSHIKYVWQGFAGSWATKEEIHGRGKRRGQTMYALVSEHFFLLSKPNWTLYYTAVST